MVIHTFLVIAIDENECEDDPAICGKNAACFNTDGSYYCQCQEGFTTHSTHNFTQADGIECEGKESLIWWISYELCAAEKTSELYGNTDTFPQGSWAQLASPVLMLPSRAIGNFLFPTYEVVITSLSYSSALISERIKCSIPLVDNHI